MAHNSNSSKDLGKHMDCGASKGAGGRHQFKGKNASAKGGGKAGPSKGTDDSSTSNSTIGNHSYEDRGNSAGRSEKKGNSTASSQQGTAKSDDAAMGADKKDSGTGTGVSPTGHHDNNKDTNSCDTLDSVAPFTGHPVEKSRDKDADPPAQAGNEEEAKLCSVGTQSATAAGLITENGEFMTKVDLSVSPPSSRR